MERVISSVGLLTMVGLAWLISEDRRKLNVRLILSGVALQVALAALLLNTPLRDIVFYCAKRFVLGLIACSDEGARFVFGESFYTDEFIKEFGSPPFFVTVLSMVIFFSSLTAVLFHLGILQWMVRLMARVMIWVMDTSGTESLAASANVFIGMTTAPLMIRPYLHTMTRSEIMAMMTGGMATAAGSTLPIYVAMGADPGHLMVASLISAPAALVIAKIMVPEGELSPTKGMVKVEVAREDANILDAACRGAAEGLKLSLNIAAMLIAFIALVALLNWILGGCSDLADWCFARLPAQDGEPWTIKELLGGQELTLQLILGWIGTPLAWLMGVERQDTPQVGAALGVKTVLNEVYAYGHLQQIQPSISYRSHTIATYALCGFANFGSIAVMIGGVSGLAPKRRSDFAKYGLRSMIGGALAAFMTASIAGMLI